MTQAAPNQPIVIDAVSDVVCPWCYIGKKRLDRAIAQASELDVTVRWRPFLLDPDVPPEGVDRRAYQAARYGAGNPSVKATQDKLTAAGAEDGIAFAFDKIRKMPNTLNAHRLILWAEAQAVQATMVERLFQLYFIEGADLGDVHVLIAAARDIGMDADFVSRQFATTQDTDRVIRDVVLWRNRGVQGVPTFILNDRYGLLGAQDTEDFVDLLRRLARGENIGRK